MKRTIYIVLALFLVQGVQAQCHCEANKKRDKLMEQSEDRKYDVRERLTKLEEAMELDEDCMDPHFKLATMSYDRAKHNPRNTFSRSLKLFEEIATKCPEYHADVHYYRGMIYLDQTEWSKASAAFDDFIRFPMDDQSKLSRGHQDKVASIEDMQEGLEASIELFENPVDFEPVKVSGVSASGDEYLPTLSPDNELIFYTRKFEKKAKGDLYGRQVEEFTWSSRDTWESDFDNGKALPPPFNKGDNYGGTTISVDNKEMYVTVCRPDLKGYNNCDIYVTEYSASSDPTTGKTVYTWGELKNLGPNVNSPLWDAQPSLSADGNTLYFATLREGSTPDPSGDPTMDIYYCKRGSNGNWAKARSLGDAINTAGHEKSPFMHGDSRTLYFASQARVGAGGYDIYYSRLQDDGSWSTPKNIGIPINTADDEHGLIVSTDGKNAYYASNKLAGAQGYDIFRFEMPEQAKPDRVVLVKGEVKNEEGEIARDAEITLNYVESKKVEKIEVNKDDGTYATIINVTEEPVVMTVAQEGHAFQAQLFTEESADEVVVEQDLTMQTMSLDKPYTIDDINYATNSAEIAENSKWVLDQFALYLKEHSGLEISIHGHTDNVGNDGDNMTLSTERAFEVMNYLQYKGVKPSSMTFKGFGSTRPLASNDSVDGRAANRRTEFIIKRLD